MLKPKNYPRVDVGRTATGTEPTWALGLVAQIWHFGSSSKIRAGLVEDSKKSSAPPKTSGISWAAESIFLCLISLFVWLVMSPKCFREGPETPETQRDRTGTFPETPESPEPGSNKLNTLTP